MKRILKITILVLIITFLTSGTLFADEGDTTQETGDVTQEQEVNINIDLGEEDVIEETEGLTDIGTQQIIAFGITTPLIGGADYKEVNGERYVTNMSGVNGGLGYTSRNYFGNGLPSSGVSGYFEYGTLGLIVPYAGVGFTFRASDTFFIDLGLPNFGMGFTF